MEARLSPNWVFVLVILAGLGTLVGSQRGVVVHTAQDRDLRLTSHRLGEPVDRVEKGRQALRKATRLVGEITGEKSVSVLAKLWTSLDRKHAILEIRRMIELLRNTAGGASEGETYRLATAAARSLSAALLPLDVDAAREVLKNWPAAPDGHEELDLESYQRQRTWEYQGFRELADRDVGAALDLLPELEAGLIDPNLRTRLMHDLANRGRFEDATGLLDGMLNNISDLDPGAAASGLESVIYYLEHRSPDRLPEVLQAWARVVQDVPDEQNLSYQRQYVPDGLQLTLLETRAALTLSRLNWAPPEVLRAALSQFPGLQQKLKGVGGPRGLRAEIQRQQAAKSQQSRRGLEGATIDSLGSSLKRVETGAVAERQLRSLLSRLEPYYEDGPNHDPESGARRFLRLARLIEQGEDPLIRNRMFRSLGRYYMTYEGELSDDLLKLGWDLLEQSERRFQAEPDAEKKEALLKQLDVLEVWLLAAWAWSDFQAAIKHIETLHAEVQFAALVKVAGWFARSQHTSWRQTFH